MIVDNLKNCRKYEGVHPNFKAAFDFLEKAVAEDLPCGRYELDGTSLFANVMEYTAVYKEDSEYEAHRKYIDVQFIVKGVERIKSLQLDATECAVAYSEEKDIGLYRGNHAYADEAVLEAGEYGIYFPNDAHWPGLPFGKEDSTVKKIVVKVKL